MPRSAGTGLVLEFAGGQGSVIAGKAARWASVLAVAVSLGGYLAPLRAEDAKPAEAAAEKAPEKSDSDAPPAKYRLAYKFRDDESVFYEVNTDMVVVTRYMEDKEEARNKTEARKHYRVAKVHPDGSADLELFIDWVRMSAKLGPNDSGVEFDSAKPETHRAKFGHIINAIGKPQALMQFSPKGNLLKIHHAAENTAIGEIPKAQAGQVSGEAHQTFLVILPEKEIAIGETWKDRFTVQVTVEKNFFKPIKLMHLYKLESVEDGIAKISMSTSIIDIVNEPAISAQLIQREIKGVIEFDIEKGLIVSRHTSCDKEVVAPFGANTAMQAAHTHVERLAPAPATAQKDAPAKAGDSK
ncbi:MAG TPA: DUF6263 family protein [Planctomycetaceae bacterium]|nr:DUF6263 family protein [Planctomycetaceae bacterium]